MASITQRPAVLNLSGVGGSPFILTAEITLTDSEGDPIDWTDVTGYEVLLDPAIASGIPTIVNPGSGVLVITWTGAQTAVLMNRSYTWALQLTLESLGAFSVVAGTLNMGEPTQPGASTSATGEIDVSVGNVTVDIAVTLGGGSGGAVASVNGQTGIVVLDAADVGADVAGAAATAQSNAESFATTSITNLHLGTASTHAATDFDTAGSAAAAQAAAEAASDPVGSAAAAQAAAEAASVPIGDLPLSIANGGTGGTSQATARTALGLGTAATHASTDFDAAGSAAAAQAAAEAASDPVGSAATAQAAAIATAETYADTNKLAKSANLSDVAEAGSTRANIHVPMLTPAAAVATSNVTSLSTATTTIDGYSLAQNDLVLLTAQTTVSQNGLWLVPASGAWTRPTEFASGAVVKGRFEFVMDGTVYAQSIWLLLTPTAGITVDTSSQTWVNFLAGPFAETMIRLNAPNQMAPLTGSIAAGGQVVAVGAAPATVAGMTPTLEQTSSWVQDINAWTRASNTTFTIAGVNVTSTYLPGVCVKWTESGVQKYGVVASSAFSTNTTVTLAVTSDYVMATSPDTNSNNYSSGVPTDVPDAFTWSGAAFTGFTGTVTINTATWSIKPGRRILVNFNFSGTSNATTMTATLPIPTSAKGLTNGSSAGYDNNNWTQLALSTLVNSSTLTFLRALSGGSLVTTTFTTSNAKGALGQIEYGI